MAQRYDLENLLADIESLIKTHLNTKIAALDAEKVAAGGVAVLSPVDDNAYYRQTWDSECLNYSPAIFFGFEEIQSQGANSATLYVMKIFIEVILTDTGIEPTKPWLNQVLRYSRALKEIFQENFDTLPWSNKTNIETTRPLSFKLESDSSEEIRVGGISITTALA